jgi:hypothetical protein
MKSNMTKLALLAAILTFSAAEANRIEGRNRVSSKVDKNRVERALYRDSVRGEDRVNNDIRSEALDVIDRNSKDRETSVASRHSTNSKEANSRGPTREGENQQLLASRQQNITLRDKSESNGLRTEQRDDAERNSNVDGEERATLERREGVREIAVLRESRSQNYRSNRLHNRYLTKEGACVISNGQPERLAFELDI